METFLPLCHCQLSFVNGAQNNNYVVMTGPEFDEVRLYKKTVKNLSNALKHLAHVYDKYPEDLLNQNVDLDPYEVQSSKKYKILLSMSTFLREKYIWLRLFYLNPDTCLWQATTKGARLERRELGHISEFLNKLVASKMLDSVVKVEKEVLPPPSPSKVDVVVTADDSTTLEAAPASPAQTPSAAAAH
jgi:hypothetical protein